MYCELPASPKGLTLPYHPYSWIEVMLGSGQLVRLQCLGLVCTSGHWHSPAIVSRSPIVGYRLLTSDELLLK